MCRLILIEHFTYSVIFLIFKALSENSSADYLLLESLQDLTGNQSIFILSIKVNKCVLRCHKKTDK